MLLAGVVLGALVALGTMAIASDRRYATSVHSLAGVVGLASVVLVVSSATLLVAGDGAQHQHP